MHDYIQTASRACCKACWGCPLSRREDLLRVCAQYERDPAPITRHDPGLTRQSPDPAPLPALPLARSAHAEAAELYRIATEDAWGRWLWLVAELIPTGRRLPCPLLGTQQMAWPASVGPDGLRSEHTAAAQLRLVWQAVGWSTR